MSSVCTHCTGEGWEDAPLVLPLNIPKKLPQVQACSSLLGSSNPAGTEATETSEIALSSRRSVCLGMEVILQSQPMATVSTPLSYSAASGEGAGTGKPQLCPKRSGIAAGCPVC